MIMGFHHRSVFITIGFRLELRQTAVSLTVELQGSCIRASAKTPRCNSARHIKEASHNGENASTLPRELQGMVFISTQNQENLLH